MENPLLYSVSKKRIDDLGDLRNKKVLLRLDLNIPMKEKVILDETRLVAAIPTILALLEKGANLIILSHFRRPKASNPEDSLKRISLRLSELLGQEILFVEEVGSLLSSKKALPNVPIVMLENIRFFPEEETNDEAFSKALATLADVFVNDAFGTIHRCHSSTYGVAKYLPSAMGLLVEKELFFFSKLFENTKKPVVLVLGGAKVSTKIASLNNLVSFIDKLIIGGGMGFTFLKALGYEVGKSLVEEDYLNEATMILEKAKQRGVEVILPLDFLVNDRFANEGDISEVSLENFPKNSLGLDIGRRSTTLFCEHILNSALIVWNGPMGALEMSSFAKGSLAIAKAIQEVTAKGALSLIGGGESALALKMAEVLPTEVSHLSTGGGALLNLLEGIPLPGLVVLSNRV